MDSEVRGAGVDAVAQRVILRGDEVMAKVGDSVFGNVLTSLVAGAALLGVIGALIAIPVAAALQHLLQNCYFQFGMTHELWARRRDIPM